MPGRKYSIGSSYRYGFNGKENDNDVKGEGNQQDYGMRIYDPRVGRFLSTDPLTRSFAFYTPYSFAGNKPIWAIDLDGLEESGYGQRLENQWIPQLAKGKITEKQFEDRKMAASIGGGIGTLVVVETVVTKGGITKTFLLSQGLGLVEHNRAKTPEGRAAQDARFKENSLDFVKNTAGGYIVNKLAKGLMALRLQGRKELIKELADNGIKHNADNIVEIAKNQSGKTIFLETGNLQAGLTHIVKEHGDDFVKAGIKQDDIAKVVMDAATNGKQVGIAGKSRPVYEVMYNGAKKTVAVDVGSNGFVVGANPVSSYKPMPSQ